MQTLEELKAENARLENEESTEPQEVETDDQETTNDDDGDIETGEAETGEESKETELEAWQLDGDAENKFTGSDIAAAKRNLRAKLERKHNDEVERLKAENEALRQSKQSAPTESTPRPRVDDYDTDDEYNAALDDWYDKKLDARFNRAGQDRDQQRRVQEFEAQLNKSVDSHYERAAKLTEESGVNAEVYHQADLSVRQMVESIMPGRGDNVVDLLISKLGEGSEKVMYYIGRNANARAELQASLVSDPSGMSASVYLGRKMAEVTTKSVKPKSKAPTPATQIKGDESAGANNEISAIKKKYMAADKKGDAQARFNARREARKLGADVSNW